MRTIRHGVLAAVAAMAIASSGALAQEIVHDPTTFAEVRNQLNTAREELEVVREQLNAAREQLNVVRDTYQEISGYVALYGAVSDRITGYANAPERLGNQLLQCIMPTLPSIPIPDLPSVCEGANWVKDELFLQAHPTTRDEVVALQEKRAALEEDAAVRAYGLALKAKQDSTEQVDHLLEVASDASDPQSVMGVDNSRNRMLMEMLGEQSKLNALMAAMVEMMAAERLRGAPVTFRSGE